MTCIITLSFIKRKRRMLAGMVPSIVSAIKTRKTTEYLISTIVLGLFI